MRFTSFSLLFLTTSFVNAKEEDEFKQHPRMLQLLQQKRGYQDKLSDVRASSAARKKGGKKNIRGVLVSGESESKNYVNNHNNDNVDKDALADVGILSSNSHNYGSNEEDKNHNLDRDLQTCSNCCAADFACTSVTASIGDGSCNGYSACTYFGLNGSSATIGENSCNNYKACKNSARTTGRALIGDNSCNDYFSCYVLGSFGGNAIIGDNSCTGYGSCAFLSSFTSYYTVVGTGSCTGTYSCFYQGYYGNVIIGDGSCIGDLSCQVYLPDFPDDTYGNPITIGNNACTCDGCCTNIHPGSIVIDNQCTSLDEGCAGTLVLPADCSNFVCESNPKLIAACIAGRGGGEPTTQCVPKEAAGALLKQNAESKCGPCDA